MASSAARKEAQSMLGKFDTSGYKDQRKAAKSIYDTSITDAGNQWTNLQNQLNIQRKASASDFNQGRANIGEVQYLADRAERNRRLAGGTNPSGYDALSNVSNRMALNKQQSDVANTYYDALEGIQTSENIGRQTYDTALDTAKNVLDSAVANTNLAQQQDKNSYNQALAGLAEQIQSRWDAQAAASAALDANRKANEDNIKQLRLNYAGGIMNNLGDSPETSAVASAINNLRGYGFTDNEIKAFFNQYGIPLSNYSSSNNSNVVITPTTTYPRVGIAGGRKIRPGR